MNEFIAILCLIGGYALLWGFVLQLDKASGFLGNAMSKMTGRAQKWLSDYRGDTMKRRFNQAATGERNLFGEKFGWQRGLSQFAGRQARRAVLANQPGGAAFGDKFEAAEQNLLQQTALKKLAEEGGRWTGDDDLMAILSDVEGDGRSYGTALAAFSKVTEQRALDSMAQARGVKVSDLTADERATARQRGQQDAVRGIRGAAVGLGAPVGSPLMAAAAFRAKVGSVSAYNGEEFEKLATNAGVEKMHRQIIIDSMPKVANGTMSITDVVSALKKNNQRMDIAGHSFPQLMAQIAVSLARYQQGVRGDGLITDAEIDKWRNGAIQYSPPGAQIAGRTETVKVQAQQEYKQLKAAEQRVKAARSYLDPAAIGRANDAAEVFSQAQQAASLATTTEEKERAQEMVEATRKRAAQTQQELESSPAYSYVKAAEDDVDRYLASFSAKHDAMSQVSKENREWYEKLLLGNEDPGEAPGSGATVMDKVERRRSSPTFQRAHKEFTSSYGASTRAYLSQQASMQQMQQMQQAGLLPPNMGIPGGVGGPP